MKRDEMTQKLAEKFNKHSNDINSENGYESSEFELNDKSYVIISSAYFETAKHIMIDAALDLIDEIMAEKRK